LVVLSSDVLIHFCFLENEKPGTQWDVATIRKWFDDFAARKGFDPLDPNNWVSIRARELRSQPVCWFVLSYASKCSPSKQGGQTIHNRYGFAKALALAYPAQQSQGMAK